MGYAAGQHYDATVVIPHYAGRQVIECLDALFGAGDQPTEVILVDDACRDGTSAEAKDRYPSLRLLSNPVNLGFVGACNRGLAEVSSAYAVLLNDDALVEDGWLSALVGRLDADPSIGAAQPKIVRAQDPTRFDYAGAAGGLMDRYGYPFALGRWFDRCEADRGQYDTSRDIFWASGTAMIMRMNLYREIGGLERVFRMHMEEIDWCWRCHLAGYRVVSVPSARVRHYGALTLRAESYAKMYLNHRNSFLMLLKNYECSSLFSVVPVRLVLECITALGALMMGNWRRAAAALVGPVGGLLLLRRIARARAAVQAARRRSDDEVGEHIYQGSIALRYLFRRPPPPLPEEA